MPELSIAGACDCHVHIVLPKFPQIASRSYTAGPAPIESLRAVATPLGVTRFVVVQPSFYGTDNSCLLQALDELGDLGRGVAVVDPASVTSNLLESYGRRGICGLRLNLYSFAVDDARRKLERLLAETLEIVPRNWHVEIIAGIQTLTSAAPAIANTQIPIIIDHYGLPSNVTPDSAMGRALLDLLAQPNIWMKLSAPYRCSENPLATNPPSDWLRAILLAAPDRCVWGSDWPHTPIRNHEKSGVLVLQYRNIPYSRLVADFLAALPEPGMARRILVENPIRFYGFPVAQPVRQANGLQGNV